MSFGILRGFMKTLADDLKINVGGKLKAGWRCTKECIPELGCYTGIFSPVVMTCNHFANAKPRMERARKEAREEYNRERNRVWLIDGRDEHMRDLMAAERRIEQIKALELKIKELKERKKREESHPEITK